jgi:LysM domain
MVQQVRKSIIALAFFVPGALFGQAPSAPLAIKPDAPERYIVVPGDTLWGISQRYTDSPWRWPELWNMNREQIRNPHLIYPGYVIMLDRERGRLAIAPGTDTPPASAPSSAAPTTTPPTAPSSAPTAPSPATTTTTTTGPGSTRLGPRVRAESLARAEIPSIPPSIIEPFLTRPLVIEPDGLEKAPTIIATQADRVVLATGNSAYVRGLSATAQDETWYVYRKGAPLVDPDTNRTRGDEAIYLGTAQLTRPGQPATILLTSTVQEVEAGDNLVAAGRPQPINYAPRSPGKPIKGRVIGIYGGVAHVGEAGPQSIISINRGKSDGIEVGHVLALYNLGGNVRDMTKPRNAPDAFIRLPDERAGLAFVFRVFDRVSYALVMHITRPISPLDVVQTP